MDLLTNLSLFSGAGGLDLGARLVGGFKTVAYVENDHYAQGVLMSRMRDNGLDRAPIFEDVRTFRGTSLRGSIDVVSGGFPCQDLSVAGKRAGIEAGARSGLWREFARIIREVGPRFVLVENVPGLLTHPGLGVVLGDLAEMGFDAEWGVLSACAFGAPHTRERVFIVSYARRGRSRRAAGLGGYAPKWIETGANTPRRGWWAATSELPRVANGLEKRLDRARCCGQGVVVDSVVPGWSRIKEIAQDLAVKNP